VYLPDALHLGALLAFGLAAARWSPRGTPARLYLAAAAVLLPLPVVWTLGPDELLLTGKEGLLEAATEGLLLGLLIRAARARVWGLAGGAGLLLLEEIDYGQLFLGFPTPAWLLDHSLSDRANLHNLPGSLLWRLLPLGGALALSRPALAARAPAWLPRLQPGLAPAVLLALALGPAVMVLAGERRFDESAELAAVLLVTLAWQPPARRTAAGDTVRAG
jgi:hypothetical protein